MTLPQVTVDLDAVVRNWRRFQSHAEAAAVVKAEAYGLGAERVAKALAAAGCRVFYVAYAQEGAALRPILGDDVEIRVFNGPMADDLALFRSAQLTPVLNSLPQIQLWREAGEDRPAAIHIDTGMNRLGLRPSEVQDAVALHPRPVAVLTHLACADAQDDPMNARQLKKFLTAAEVFPDADKSLSASAGVWLGRDYSMDEVRPGIGLYGGGPAPSGAPLEQAAHLTATVLQVRPLPPGESSGYGATFSPEAPVMLACVGIGYADGLLRTGSNKGYASVQGQKRPIVGRISMDLTMIDITGLDVAPGDRVTLFGPELPLAAQAEAFGTIDYELLTSLGPRISRVYTGGAAE